MNHLVNEVTGKLGWEKKLFYNLAIATNTSENKMQTKFNFAKI